MSFHFYILECQHHKFYVGSCENLQKRFKAHENGDGADFTRKHKPIRVAYSEEFMNRADAMSREAQVKKWSRTKKQALVNRNSSRLKELSVSHDHLS